MADLLPTCPHLPVPRPGLDWRTLHVHREDVRGPAFYHDCLEYGHALWRQGLAGRALLCLDRALGADLRGDEPVLQEWPPPYAALAWMLREAPPVSLVGNPRVHFQHYAGRMNEPRREARRWRAWACWAVARTVLPHLPGDPRHVVNEPSPADIAAQLQRHGWPGEAGCWAAVMESAAVVGPAAG